MVSNSAKTKTRKHKPINMGLIRVTFGAADTPAELQALLRQLAEDLPVHAEMPQIVLLIPKRVRNGLGWRLAKAPRVSIWGHYLFFSPAGRHAPKVGVGPVLVLQSGRSGPRRRELTRGPG